MNYPINVSFLCESLRPCQSDINLLTELSKLDSAQYCGQVFVCDVANAPIQAAVPILSMYHAVNLRSDKLPTYYFATSPRLITTLRHLSGFGKNNKYYVYLDCPPFLYPRERHRFINNCNLLKSEFEVITSSERYSKMLSEMGCIVSKKTILDYNHLELINFMEGS